MSVRGGKNRQSCWPGGMGFQRTASVAGEVRVLVAHPAVDGGGEPAAVERPADVVEVEELAVGCWRGLRVSISWEWMPFVA